MLFEGMLSFVDSFSYVIFMDWLLTQKPREQNNTIYVLLITNFSVCALLRVSGHRKKKLPRVDETFIFLFTNYKVIY